MKKYDRDFLKDNFIKKFEKLLNERYRDIPKAKRRNQFIKEIDQADNNTTITRNKIGDWYRKKNTVAPSLNVLIELSNFFNCDIDFFLTDMKAPTHDTEFIEKETGLSVDAIQELENISQFENVMLDLMLRKKYLWHLCYPIYSYMQMYYKEANLLDKDTGDNKLSDTEKMDIAEYRASKYFSKFLVDVLSKDEDIRMLNEFQHQLEWLHKYNESHKDSMEKLKTEYEKMNKAERDRIRRKVRKKLKRQP